MIKVYGIPNCDKVRKTRRYLEEQNIEYLFYDLRKYGITSSILSRWVKTLTWEKLLNRQSVSFRTIPDIDKTLINQKRAIELMLRIPTLIKRPIIEHKNEIYIGCTEKVLNALTT